MYIYTMIDILDIIALFVVYFGFAVNSVAMFFHYPTEQDLPYLTLPLYAYLSQLITRNKKPANTLSDTTSEDKPKMS
jgi:hypothetical protein